MGTVTKVMIEGREMIAMPPEDYEALIDAKDAALALADYRSGRDPGISGDDMVALLDAPTPLAFWRKRSGKTQTAVAAQVGISQPYLAQLEAGVREPMAGVLAKIARAIGVQIDDLLIEDDGVTPDAGEL